MIDLDKFLSLFYERDDPVMCYVWICVLCVCFVFCVVYGVLRSVWFVFLFFSFPLTFGQLFCFLSFLFFSTFSFMGWPASGMEWAGMGYKANSARRYHIYPFSIDISDNDRHDLHFILYSSFRMPCYS